ncbi:glycoside hydrolase family 47 protein [Baudoinia panamericana UAMH 10762]|uniref:alpha-1,2-Mannosidase n=1 Tax=Baudoinia panamericana (strain UAMH 10762) TaxID=717646 RepID=M2NL49_BAUPA|nr:glycoside hydrolase family 47 protein [Baudoinia panamericana UAMH 10762]EMD00200.1 glycoside hydrolase family 47 protein [Baudoinia panamericana UAMH 10762]
MPSPRRRVRLIFGVLVFIAVVLVYTRRAQVEEYRDYVTARVVGGGAVLREKQQDQQAPLRATEYHEYPDAIRTAGPAAVLGGQELKSSSSRLAQLSVTYVTTASTKSLGTGVPAAVQTTSLPAQALPPSAHGDDTSNEVPEGRIENKAPVVSTTSAIHWTKFPEHFPITSTIPLPTGTSKPFPRIQYAGKDAGQADTERLAIIKQAAQHAWDGYAEMAWGMDEVKPISGRYNNPFNGWGATLVDSLDTLWIMGMKEEFEDALEFVADIDFTTSLRADIPLFETTIRYLGGLLGAYDVSGAQYRVLLDQASSLAEVLYAAFDTPNRMPDTFYRWKPAFASQPHRAKARVVMAELGSLSLEFTRLAQLTGEPKYYDAIARITDAFDEWQNSTRLPGMWPINVDASGCMKPAQLAQGFPVPGSRQQSVPGASANIVSTSSQKVDPEQQLKAQAKLDAQAVKEKVTNALGSSKVKRQLDVEQIDAARNASTEQTAWNSTRFRDELRRSPPVIHEPENLTGTDPCEPQGLASPNKFSQEVFTLGGQSDSTYEYLPKEYMLLGGAIEQYKDMYIASADAVINNLIYRPMTQDGTDVLISGSMKVSVNTTTGEYIKELAPEAEHLTCFAGGMFAMAGKIFNRPGDVQIGRKLTDGCVWAYNATTTGIMPEIFEAIECENWSDCKWNQTAYWQKLDPYEETRTKIPANLAATNSAPALAHTSTSVAVAAQTSTTSSAMAEVTESAEVKIPEEDRWSNNPAKDKPTGSELASEWIKTGGSDMSALDDTPTRWTDETKQGSSESSSNPKIVGFTKRQLEKLDDLPYVGEAAVDSSSAAVAASRATTTPAAQATVPSPNTAVYTPKPPLSHSEFVQKKIEDERLPPGFVRIKDRRYILRPEAIESVFYMYRITGEQYWRDMGWKMFLAVDEHTTALYGNSAIDDVTKMAPEQKDSMESFWLAETLKYFYLLFDDAEKWSLDDWVLNTEAHFFRRPKYEFEA